MKAHFIVIYTPLHFHFPFPTNNPNSHTLYIDHPNKHTHIHTQSCKVKYMISMASKKSYAKLSSLFNEQEWVIKIRSTLEGEVEEEDTNTLVSIFCVPKELLNCKPEAYAPQVFAFGPYHHWRTHLYDMERYKLAAARRVQSLLLDGLRLHQVVDQFMKHDYKIRCHYHKYLDFNGETLVWMMVIDASFLIQFFQTHANNTQLVLARTLSKRIENEKTKIFFNMILRDIMMLENQMPLFLLRKLLSLQFPTKELADDELARVLAVFVKEVSPIKSMENFPLVDDIGSHSHLLDLLYCMIVPKAPSTDENNIVEEEEEEEDGEGEAGEGKAKEVDELGDSTGVIKKAFTWGWTSVLSGINRGPMRIVKRVIVAKPVKLVVKFPWKVVSALPIFSIMKQPVESFFTNLVSGGKAKSEDDGGSSHVDRPPLAEEIAIPSVAELCDAGVQFLPRINGNVMSIEFDTKTATIYLPVVSLDVNTEVILRNLVAYEASAVSGPLVFTRYTELMNGIIDAEEDVRILRERGIVVNRMKSDGEAAALWNGMSKSVRLSKVRFLDTVIRDVNKYYRSRWRVKSKEFMKKYVFGSWQVLTLLAAALLLFLTCVQAFCSVYSCNSHLTKFSNVAN